MVDTSSKSFEACSYTASALKAAHEMSWPNSPGGAATALCIHDLAEFGTAATFAASGGMWSVERALERLFIERVQVLMAIPKDAKFARRYIDTINTAQSPNKRPPRGLADDAWASFSKRSNLTKDELNGYRDAILDLKNAASTWFVHPTAMGPWNSLRIEGAPVTDPQIVAAQWANLLSILGMACVYSVLAAVELEVRVDETLVKSLEAVATALPADRESMAAMVREAHSGLKVLWIHSRGG